MKFSKRGDIKQLFKSISNYTKKIGKRPKMTKKV